MVGISSSQIGMMIGLIGETVTINPTMPTEKTIKALFDALPQSDEFNDLRHTSYDPKLTVRSEDIGGFEDGFTVQIRSLMFRTADIQNDYQGVSVVYLVETGGM